MDNDEFVAMPDENDLRKIARLGQELVLVNREIMDRTRELETIQKRFKDISEDELPTAMLAVNMAEFKLATGYRIVIEPIFNVRLPKQNTEKADAWLDENGHGGMIKRVMQIELPKNIANWKLDQLKKILKDTGYSYEILKTVHWATVQSWGNEMREAGDIIPEDIFTVYRGNRTVITE